MNSSEVEKFRNYPEGSGGRKIFDYYNLSFEDYLLKYYSNPDLSNWNTIFKTFVQPIFSGEDTSKYLLKLERIKPGFSPNIEQAKTYYNLIKEDERFDKELKMFFFISLFNRVYAKS